MINFSDYLRIVQSPNGINFSKVFQTSVVSLPMPDKLIAVIKISKRGSSLRITLPKEIAEKLNVSQSEHIGFYEGNGDIVVRKIE